MNLSVPILNAQKPEEASSDPEDASPDTGDASPDPDSGMRRQHQPGLTRSPRENGTPWLPAQLRLG